MGFLDDLKKKAQTLGEEALKKGTELADKGIAASEVFAAQGSDALKKASLKTMFAFALEDIARGKLNVNVKLAELHSASLMNPTYSEAFNAFALALQTAPAPAPATKPQEGAKTIQDNAREIIDIGTTAVNALGADISRKKALADLAVDNAPKPVAYYLG